MADAIGTTVGAVLGTSTVTTFVESASGVTAGGRTGLTAMTSALLFLASMFFAPIFTAIPAFATAPALTMVGFLIIAQIGRLNFDDLSELIPCLLAIIVMPFSYNIADGIGFGFISWTCINMLCGHCERVNPILIGASLLFLAKYPFL